MTRNLTAEGVLPRDLTKGFVAVCAAVALGGSWAFPLFAQGACKRPAVKSSYQRAAVVLKQSGGFPCTIEVVPTGVVLKPLPGRVDNIGRKVTRAPDGRLYTAIPSEGTITVWAKDGTFLFNLGREGKGPGEFAKGEKTIDVDHAGRLFVSDNNFRWSIFDPSHRFITSISSAMIGAGALPHALLDDGTFLSSTGHTLGAFRIFDTRAAPDPSPPLLLAFGPKATDNKPTRSLAYARGTSFWAGSPTGVKFEYTLQQWSTDGRLLRTIRREVPWLRGDVTDSPESGIQPGMNIHDDGTGLLFVSIAVPRAAYAELSPAERRQRDEGGPADRAVRSYLEVIDVNAEAVLASIGPLSPAQFGRRLPNSFFPRSRDGYQIREDQDGFRTMQILETRLVQKSGR